MGRKSRGKTIMLARVQPDTTSKIQEIAKSLGYLYAGQGSQGALLDAIASGHLTIIKTSDL